MPLAPRRTHMHTHSARPPHRRNRTPSWKESPPHLAVVDTHEEEQGGVAPIHDLHIIVLYKVALHREGQRQMQGAGFKET